MMRDNFAHGVLALVMRRSWCDTFGVHVLGRGRAQGYLQILYIVIFGFMWEQIRVVQWFMLVVCPEVCL